MKTAADLIERVADGVSAADVIGEAAPLNEDIAAAIASISSKTRDLPGFIDALWRKAKREIRDKTACDQVVRQLKSAQQKARECDQLMGGALVVASGGTYKD